MRLKARLHSAVQNEYNLFLQYVSNLSVHVLFYQLHTETCSSFCG